MTDSSAPLKPPAPLLTESSSRRVPGLDVLRGIAILGTLASNIWIFTGVLEANATALPAWFGQVLQWVPNGKFLGLLTIMFGIGLEIQRQAAVRAGKSWPGTYPVRAGLLFLDGLLNYVLVVQFDVLRAYAVTGFIVAFLLLTSERVQWWLASIFIAAHLTLLTLQALPVSADETRSVEPAGDPAVVGAGKLGGMSNVLGYWDGVWFTITRLGDGFNFGSEFFTIVLMGVGLFLLGAKLYRFGIFGPERRRLRRGLMFAGLAALPIDYLLSHVEGSPLTLGSYARYGAAAVVALGILALVAEFYQRRQPGRVGRLLGLVGKMALSCYLLQNILGVILRDVFAPSLETAHVDWLLGTVAAFVVMSLFLVTVSAFWLRAFKRGPFEQVWHWAFVLITGRTSRDRAPLAAS